MRSEEKARLFCLSSAKTMCARMLGTSCFAFEMTISEQRLSDSPEEHIRNAIEALSVALNEAKEALQILARTPRRTQQNHGRHLQLHPMSRKRVVFIFLAWCWKASEEHGFSGPIPDTLQEEFHLFTIWSKKMCPPRLRPAATEITTFREYVACREGGRKMWPEKWKALQSARHSWLGQR